MSGLFLQAVPPEAKLMLTSDTIVISRLICAMLPSCVALSCDLGSGRAMSPESGPVTNVGSLKEESTHFYRRGTNLEKGSDSFKPTWREGLGNSLWTPYLVLFCNPKLLGSFNKPVSCVRGEHSPWTVCVQRKYSVPLDL